MPDFAKIVFRGLFLQFMFCLPTQTHAYQNNNQNNFPYSQLGIIKPLRWDMSQLFIKYASLCEVRGVSELRELTDKIECDFMLSYVEMKKIEEWLNKQVQLTEHFDISSLDSHEIVIDKSWDEFYLTTVVWNYSIRFPVDDMDKSISVVNKIIKWAFLRQKLSQILWAEAIRKEFRISVEIDNVTRNTELALISVKSASEHSLNQIWLFSSNKMNCASDKNCEENVNQLLLKTCQLAKKYEERSHDIIDSFKYEIGLGDKYGEEIFSSLVLKSEIEIEITKKLIDHFRLKKDFLLNNRDLVMRIINKAKKPSANIIVVDETRKIESLMKVRSIARECGSQASIVSRITSVTESLNSDSIAYFKKIEKEIEESLKYFELKYNLLLEEMR